MMNKCFFFFLMLLCFGLEAQPFLYQERGQNSDEFNIGDLEDRFLSWKQGRDLDADKGYKWYARWLEQQIHRTTSSGTWPAYENLFEVAEEIAELKSNLDTRTPGGWIPVGPADFPEIPGGSLFHGMGRINTVAFHPTDAKTLWVGVAQGGVWKSTDGGKHWRPLTDNLPIIRISDIAVDPNDTDVLYICVGDYAYLGSALDTDARKRNTHYGLGVYKTIDGGETWSPTGLTFGQNEKDGSLMRRVFIDPDNSERLVAAGISGVYGSLDGGDTWTKTLDEVMADIERNPTDASILYASSHWVNDLAIGRPGIWKSEDYGASWTELNSGISGNGVQRIELAIAPSNPEMIYALACNLNGGLYAFYRSTDGGLNWTMRADQPNILHWYGGTSDGGQGTYDLSIMVDPQDSDKVYAGGINMWGSEDGGLNWKRASFWLPDYGPSLHADHHQYKFNPVDEYFYACHDGGINRTKKIHLVTTDSLNIPGFQFKTQWEDISAGMEISSFYRMDVGKIHGDLIAGAQDNSTFYKRDTQWLNTVLGDGMDCFFHPTDASVAYTSTQGGRLVRLENRGLTSTGSLTGQFTFGEQAAWTTPFEADPFNPDGIYTAFENVWRSADQGETWTQLTDIEAELNGERNLISSSFSISPSNENRFYVAKRIFPTRGRKGEMWRTDDGGATVLNITEGLPDSLFITATAVSDVNPDLVWATFGGFIDGLKVFRSDDAGENWSNISSNLPNIPINAVEFIPGSISNTIYIGTDVGVYFIDDLLNEWQFYSKELPNVIVTDLVVDSENEEIYVSTFGRGIWKSDLAIISATKDVDPLNMFLSLAPNPNEGKFKLTLNQDRVQPVEIILVDINGREHMRYQMKEAKHFELEYDLDLPAGLYFVKVSSSEGSVVQRLVVE